MKSAADAIGREIADAPVVDTHEHLRPISELRPMSVAKLIQTSYVQFSLRAPDGSTNTIGTKLDVPLEEDTWPEVEAALMRVRFTSFNHWLMRGVAELYDLSEPRLTRESWHYLSEELPRRYQDDGWLGTVLDRAHINDVVWDPAWKPGLWTSPDVRIRPSLRINSSLVAFHPDAGDFEGRNVIRDWAEAFDLEINSLAQLEALLVALIDRNVEAGAVSLKSAIAYERTIEVGAAPRAEAERVFGRSPDDVSRRERLLFGDYLIRFYLDQARERNLVLQVHTGLARLGDSGPMKLRSLLEDFPNVTFDLFHGGYPWVSEVAALALAYPNVRLNLAWLPQISTEAATSALKEWIQVVPQIDRISWGGDSRVPEEAYGALLAAKHSISQALGALVEERLLTFNEAIDAATSILSTAGTLIYNRNRIAV